MDNHLRRRILVSYPHNNVYYQGKSEINYNSSKCLLLQDGSYTTLHWPINLSFDSYIRDIKFLTMVETFTPCNNYQGTFSHGWTYTSSFSPNTSYYNRFALSIRRVNRFTFCNSDFWNINILPYTTTALDDGNGPNKIYRASQSYTKFTLQDLTDESSELIEVDCTREFDNANISEPYSYNSYIHQFSSIRGWSYGRSLWYDSAIWYTDKYLLFHAYPINQDGNIGVYDEVSGTSMFFDTASCTPLFFNSLEEAQNYINQS